METVITLTAEKAQPKTYKITFVETLVRPLKEVQTALGWNQGAIANSNKNIIKMKIIYQVVKDGRTLTTYEDKFNAETYAKKVNGIIKEQQTDSSFEIPEFDIIKYK